MPLDCIDRFALRPGRVARVLDVGIRTVRAWIGSGALPSVRVDGVVLVLVVDLLRFLEEHRRLGTHASSNVGLKSLTERAEDFIGG